MKEFGRSMRPYMVPTSYPGYYTVDDRPNPGCGKVTPPFINQRPERRRVDVGSPAWFKGGVPTQYSCQGQDVLFTLATPEMRPLATYTTENGPINLPYGPMADNSYMPTAETLSTLYDIDSRRTAISDRYYR